MFAEFSRSKPCEFMTNKVLMATVTSTLMVSQQVLKKAPVKKITEHRLQGNLRVETKQNSIPYINVDFSQAKPSRKTPRDQSSEAPSRRN